MDIALLLFLPLVGGYWFSERFDRSKYKSAREHGYRLHYRAATNAVFLVIGAALLREFLMVFETYSAFENTLHTHLDTFINEKNKSDRTPLLLISFYALLLGIFIPRLLNIMDPEMKAKAFHAAIEENDFERLVHNAGQKLIPLCVTTDSGKVYVGQVVKTPDPRIERKSLTIQPIMSGYVGEDKDLCFTTFYQSVYKELKTNPEKYRVKIPEDFIKVLPVSTIQSVNMFDTDMYDYFLENKLERMQSESDDD